MPRVNYVKRARKDNPVCKKGESYYWWQFAFSSKSYSLKRPRASQLTRSAYYSTLYALTEQIEDSTVDSVDSITCLRDDALSALEELRDETEEKLQNMSEHGLENTPTGEMIQERVDALESAISEIENLDVDIDEPDEDDPDLDDDEREEAKEKFQDQIDDLKSELIDFVGEAHV